MRELVALHLRRRARGTLLWGLALSLTSVLMLASFTAFDPKQMEALTSSISPKVLEAFGASAASFLTPEGFLAGKLLSYLPAVLAFLPISIAARGLAGAEPDGTLDVLLTQPLPRWKLPVALAITMFVSLTGVLAIYAAGTLIGAWLLEIRLSARAVVDSAIGLLPISLAFGGLALALSAALRRPGEVTAVAGGIVVVSYLINTLVLVVSQLHDLQWITAFHWYGSPIERGMPAGGCALLLAAAGLGVAASVLAFRRRDITG